MQFVSWGRYGHGKMFHRVCGRLYGNVTNIVTNSFGKKVVMNALQSVEPGILAGLQEEIDEGGLKQTSGFHPLLILRLISIGLTALPQYLMTVMFPNRSRRALYDITDELVASVEKEANDVHNLADAILYKKKMLQSVMPRVVSKFWPRVAVAVQSIILLNKMAEKLPDGGSQVLTITVSIQVVDDELIVRPSSTNWSSFHSVDFHTT